MYHMHPELANAYRFTLAERLLDVAVFADPSGRCVVRFMEIPSLVPDIVKKEGRRTRETGHG